MNKLISKVMVKARRLDNGKVIKGLLFEQVKYQPVVYEDESEELKVISEELAIEIIERDKSGKIILAEIHSIDPETLVESTGMTDVDGVLLFRSDKVLTLETQGKLLEDTVCTITANPAELGYTLDDRFKLTRNKKVRYMGTVLED